MSHTYTRTAALLDEFAASFEKADLIILHKIYSSAREVYKGGVSGRTLFEKSRDVNSGKPCYYFDECEEGAEFLSGLLKPGDLFITMGAGDNWKLGKKLFDFYRETK
jgi:UDP-N-acetylmuramate--alanine ligase